MSKLACAVSAAVVMTLANCTGSTDPATGTVIDNFINTREGGVFDQQIAENRAEAAALRITNAQTQDRIDAAERQRSDNAATLSALRQEVTSLRAEIASARARVAANANATQQLASLDQQALAVQRDVEAGGDPGIARAELGQIRAAVRQISS